MAVFENATAFTLCDAICHVLFPSLPTTFFKSLK